MSICINKPQLPEKHCQKMTKKAKHSISNSIDHSSSNHSKRIAFADDFTGTGTLEHLKAWWCEINESGPYIGYYPNASKSLLIVKEQYIDEAKTLFAGSEVTITTEGHKHLGAVIGNPQKKFPSGAEK